MPTDEPAEPTVPPPLLAAFIQDVMGEERRYGYERRDAKSDRVKAVKDLVIRYAKKLEEK